MNPIFSIIIPHYNCQDLLHRAIMSIPNSDNIEILVVDNSPTPIDKYLFSQTRDNIKILYSSPQRGAGGARNVGLDNASGKWILFLDSDDFFTSTAFDTFYRYVESHHDLIVFDMCGCYSDSLMPISQNSFFFPIISDYLAKKYDAENRLRYGCISQCSKMIKRSLIINHDVRFDEVCANNDDMFSLKIGYYAASIYASIDCVYCYTMRKGSIIHKMSKEIIETRINVLLDKNKFLRNHSLGKYQTSIMYLLYQARQYGYMFVLKMGFKSLRSGMNIFIGFNNWINSYRKVHNMEKSNGNCITY